MANNPKVSYIILNWNPHGDLQFVHPRFLQTVEKFYKNCDPSISKEVILIDQGSPESVTKDIERLQKQHHFQAVYLTENIGLSGGVNLGFNMARGKYMCVLTYDVLITKGCDTECIRMMDNCPDVYELIPLTSKSDYPFQMAQVGAEFGTDEVRLPNRPTIDVVSTEMSMNFFRREVLQLVGYYDEYWKACFEVADYNLRIVLAGGKVRVCPNAFAWHYHNTSANYIGLLTAYDGVYGPDPLGDQTLYKKMMSKWSPRVKEEINWSAPYNLNEDMRKHLLEKYKANIFLPYVQTRNY